MVESAQKPLQEPPVPPPHRPNSISDEPVRVIELNGHVGFDSMPHQLVKKAIEQGFQFNLMCVGETGIGKTTLIESLFNMKLEFDTCEHELDTVELRSKSYEVVEGGIRLKMTIVETAGFGDHLDKNKNAQVIVGHINEQFEMYFREELKVRRLLAYYEDTRIHACLYFIPPSGHKLKPLDLMTLKELSKRVNVIPLIAKSDTIAKDDLANFKSKILAELAHNKIEIYEFPTYDETVLAVNTEMNSCVPFAVVGSTDFVQKGNGKSVRARRYPWGILEVENEQHCDFVKLREALLRTNVDSLRERTHTVLYEQYRRERLRSMSVGDGDIGPKLAQTYTQKSKEMHAENARKEAELREDFNRRLTKREEELRREEEALNVRSNEMEANFERQLQAIDAEIKQLQDEKIRLETKTLKKNKK